MFHVHDASAWYANFFASAVLTTESAKWFNVWLISVRRALMVPQESSIGSEEMLCSAAAASQNLRL
jgi:hypothetical protein